MRTVVRLSLLCIIIGLPGVQSARSQNFFYDAMALNKFVWKLRDTLDITGTPVDELPGNPKVTEFVKSAGTETASLWEQSNLRIFLANPLSDSVDSAAWIRAEVDSLYHSLFGVPITRIVPAVRERTRTATARARQAAATVVSFDLAVQSAGTGLAPGGVPLSLESRLIYATADLIVDRFSEELSLAFFRKFQSAIDGGVLPRLLPNTKRFLVVALDHPLLLPSLGQAWRAAFNADLAGLPESFSEVCNESLTGGEHELALIVSGALETYTKLQSGMHPANILHAFAERRKPDERGKLQRIIAFLDRISWNLLNAERTAWLAPEQMRLLENPESMTYFVGLVYQAHRGDFHDLGIKPHDIDSARQQFSTQLSEMISITRSIENTILRYKEKIRDGKGFTAAEYIGYVRQVFDLIAFGQKLSTLTATTQDQTFNTVYVPLSKQVLKTIEAAELRDYGAVLVHVLGLMQSVDSTGKIFNTDVTSKLLRYGSFMVDIVNAKTVEETKSAIEAVALPAGSYSLKRKSSFSVGINAYGGLSAGRELVQAQGGEYADGKLHGGLFAPVGVEFARGKTGRFIASISVFLSILDLGAVVNYRIGGERSETVPNIGFAQVFSPGIFAILGLGREVPVSVGFGAQFNPKLRIITDDQGAILGDGNTLKFSGFIAVDIPLFNLVAR